MTEYIDLDTPLELKVARGQTYKPYTSTLRELLDLNRIPYTAADVRPVARGKWIGGNGVDYVRCGCCHKNYDWVSQAQYYNFCPNCGADMRGREDERSD